MWLGWQLIAILWSVNLNANCFLPNWASLKFIRHTGLNFFPEFRPWSVTDIVGFLAYHLIFLLGNHIFSEIKIEALWVASLPSWTISDHKLPMHVYQECKKSNKWKTSVTNFKNIENYFSAVVVDLSSSQHRFVNFSEQLTPNDFHFLSTSLKITGYGNWRQPAQIER